MRMLKMFEKLINEHGSSTILRERLELFSDKYAMLEEKNRHLTERNNELDSKLNKAHEEICRLNEIIEAAAKSQSIPKLKDVEITILKLLFDQNEEVSAYGIALEFDLDVGVAAYHLNNLFELELVSDTIDVEKEIAYLITPKGRTYIMEHT